MGRIGTEVGISIQRMTHMFDFEPWYERRLLSKLVPLFGHMLSHAIAKSIGLTVNIKFFLHELQRL